VGGVRRRAHTGVRSTGGRKTGGSKVEDKRSNYLGITGRSLHARQADHVAAVARGDMTYALARHMRDVHGQDGFVPKFTMKLISRHKTNLEKQNTKTRCELVVSHDPSIHGGVVGRNPFF
jgi:hypothetical protein